MKKKTLKAADMIYSQMRVSSSTSVTDAGKFMKSHDLQYVAVVDDQKIMGLLGGEKISVRNGLDAAWSIYTEQPVYYIMNASPMIVDESMDGMMLAQNVMERPINTFYDDVVVTSQNGEYLGLISVKLLMLMLHDEVEEKEKSLVKHRFLLTEILSPYLTGGVMNKESLRSKMGAIVELAHQIDCMDRRFVTPESRTFTGHNIEGKLEVYDALDLVQILILGRRTGRLNLRSGNHDDHQHFEIFFQSGKIAHASGAGDRGKEALWKALRLRNGVFDFFFGKVSEEKSIESSSSNFLVNAYRNHGEKCLLMKDVL